MDCWKTSIFNFVFLYYYVQPILAQGTLSSNLNQCICPGDKLTYECTVEGNNTGTTIWTGTAFDCPELDNEFLLLHVRRFTESVLGCSNGAITGSGIRVMGNNYTSQLNLTVDPSMDGKTVICSYDNGYFVTVIGNSSIQFTTDPFPPPTDVSVNIKNDIVMDPLRLTFKWSPVTLACTDIRYITDFDCGYCPNTTAKAVTEIVCTDIVISSQTECRFTVQTQVCGSITGSINIVQLTLKVPKIPEFNELIPTYGAETGNLTVLTIILKEMELYDAIAPSFSYYCLLLMDSDLGMRQTCFSANISASLFVTGSYNYMFNNNSLSECHSFKTFVSLFATNVLGSGQSSESNKTLELSNHFVKVDYDQNLSTIYCKFNTSASIDTQEDKIGYNCSVAYGVNKSDKVTGMAMYNNTVVLHLEPIHDEHRHFTVTASYGTYTVNVDGIFKTNNEPEISVSADDEANIFIFTLTAIVIAVGLVVVIVLALLGLVCIFLKNKLKHNKMKTNTGQPLQLRELSPRATTPSTDGQDSSVGVYSLLQPANDEKMIYADIGPFHGKSHTINLICDDRVEYAKINHQENNVAQCQDQQSNSCENDMLISLDSLLIQLRDQVTEKWFEFGQALGVPKEVMEKYNGYPSDQCMIEMLDYWLRNHPDQPTWREVSYALESIRLNELSNQISQVYVTGELPIKVDMNANLESILHKNDQLSLTLTESVSDCSSPPSLPPKVGMLHKT